MVVHSGRTDELILTFRLGSVPRSLDTVHSLNNQQPKAWTDVDRLLSICAHLPPQSGLIFCPTRRMADVMVSTTIWRDSCLVAVCRSEVTGGVASFKSAEQTRWTSTAQPCHAQAALQRARTGRLRRPKVQLATSLRTQQMPRQKWLNT